MILPWRPVAIGDGPPISTSLTEREARALATLAAGRLVLEIGSAFGFSTVTMASTARHVLAIDPHHDHDSLLEMRANLHRHDLADRVSVLLSRSEHALPMLRAARARFDLVFIDGDHRHEAVLADVTQAVRLLHPGGTIACHDYGEATCPGVKAALDEFWAPGPDDLTDTLWVTQT